MAKGGDPATSGQVNRWMSSLTLREKVAQAIDRALAGPPATTYVGLRAATVRATAAENVRAALRSLTGYHSM